EGAAAAVDPPAGAGGAAAVPAGVAGGAAVCAGGGAAACGDAGGGDAAGAAGERSIHQPNRATTMAAAAARIVTRVVGGFGAMRVDAAIGSNATGGADSFSRSDASWITSRSIRLICRSHPISSARSHRVLMTRGMPPEICCTAVIASGLKGDAGADATARRRET